MSTQPPRSTIQAQAVEKLKTDMAHLVSLLNQYAGTLNKPNIAELNVKHYMTELNEWFPKVADARSWPAAELQQWQRLWTTYKNGKGSWTTMKQIATPLNARVQQAEA
jgi:hypothetical protein